MSNRSKVETSGIKSTILITELSNFKIERNQQVMTDTSSYSSGKNLGMLTSTGTHFFKSSQARPKSYFKVKSDFNKPKNKLLDFFINNHTEYVDLNKYENYYEAVNIKQSFISSDLLKKDKDCKIKLQELTNLTSEEIISCYHLGKAIVTSEYDLKVEELKEQM